MRLLIRYKKKEINFRLIDSLLNDIAISTDSFFEATGFFSLEYSNQTAEINTLNELYEKVEKIGAPEFFNFHIAFHKKNNGKIFDIYIFGAPIAIDFSSEGLSGKDASTVQDIFQKVFQLEKLETEERTTDEIAKTGKITKEGKAFKPTSYKQKWLSFSMDNPLVWLIFSLIVIIIGYLFFSIKRST